MNLSEILFLRMIRRKLNRGGDGVAHHRPTTDRSYIDKLVYHVGPIGRKIPLAESPSSVRFHSNHPQKIRVNLWNLWAEKSCFGSFSAIATKAAKPSGISCF